MRWYYGSTIENFLRDDQDRILGVLTTAGGYGADQAQISAWTEQICLLQDQLKGISGKVFFEFIIPRMGKRVDVILLLDNIVAVIEFKVGDSAYRASALDQVWDYALDLKNFHKTSHQTVLLPVLVATKAESSNIILRQSSHADGVLHPVGINAAQIQELIDIAITSHIPQTQQIREWEMGRYQPTPTIVEAALALYGGHNVEEIVSRGAENLSSTVELLQTIIQEAKKNLSKAICFVTGVPGAGKTLVGLDIATQNIDKCSESYSVYLSGNGPLVKVLQEALAIDSVDRAKARGEKAKKEVARRSVKMFIQNVHHFRDECIAQIGAPPEEHVVIFDESQRAWSLEMTSDFMKRKKGISEFNMSEPEFLISCMDRHQDWAVVICLVGGGQEINRGEAGIVEWLAAVERAYTNWSIYCSPDLVGNNYIPTTKYAKFKEMLDVTELPNLHLATSMRSFRAAQLSDMVNAIIARDLDEAKRTYDQIKDRYPLCITRDVNKGRDWLKKMARGTQRFGMVVSSKAYRLRPHAIDVRIPADPIHWFLGSKDDVRSSYYLEDVATEFQIQGLELDWVCVTWDADLRFNAGQWNHYNFAGSKWKRIKMPVNQQYLENAYRVLLTRARQGMVLVVPEGAEDDATRHKSYYDATFKYLKSVGLQEI